MYPHTRNTHSDTLNHGEPSKLSMDLSQSTSNIHLQLFVVFLLLALSLLSCCIISAHHLQCVVLLKKFWPFFLVRVFSTLKQTLGFLLKKLLHKCSVISEVMGARGLQQSIWQVMQEPPGEDLVFKPMPVSVQNNWPSVVPYVMFIHFYASQTFLVLFSFWFCLSTLSSEMILLADINEVYSFFF